MYGLHANHSFYPPDDRSVDDDGSLVGRSVGRPGSEFLRG